MNNSKKQILLTIIMITVLMAVLNSFSSLSGAGGGHTQERSYSQFLDSVNNDEVKSVTFDLEEFRINYILQSGKNLYAYNPEALDTESLIPVLRSHNVEISAKERYKESMLSKVILSVLPILLVVGIIIYFSRQMQGGGKGGMGPLSFGKSKARLIDPDKSKIT